MTGDKKKKNPARRISRSNLDLAHLSHRRQRYAAASTRRCMYRSAGRGKGNQADRGAKSTETESRAECYLKGNATPRILPHKGRSSCRGR